MRKTALVTGASSGIGKEFAKIFARQGYDLILVARNEAALRELAASLQKEHGISAKVIAQDLAQREGPEKIYREVERTSLAVDILVNNAGFGVHGFFKDTDLLAELEMIQLNMATLTHLTKLFLPQMIQRGFGKILMVASTAAFQPGPLMAVYYATKAYVVSFSEALSRELQGTGVTVTVLCPGPTTSNFQARTGIQDIPLIRFGLLQEASEAALAGYVGLMRKKRVVIPGFVNRAFAFLVRFAPRGLLLQIIYGFQYDRRKQKSLPAGRQGGGR